jgi:oxygen-independent coproporphyrinogen-3 oxidase
METAAARHRPRTGNYFVATYPPFSCWNEAGAREYLRALGEPRPGPAATPLGLYVHVPFCARRCDYCYYLSYAGRGGEIERYAAALLREAELYRATEAVRGGTDFVYFGGGTPSLLTPRAIAELLGGLRERLDWKDGAEITFECAPRSVTREKLAALRDAGVTRVSLGVQQLDDAVLAASGRIHRSADALRAYGEIRSAGFDLVNVDLIAGLPEQTADGFLRSLEQVVELAPESITLYQLEVPLNTPLYRAGATREPASWPETRARVGAAFERLEAAGYTVRSAYAAVRDPARHRFLYQDAQYDGASLLGLGASSFGHVNGVNQQNLASLDAYVAAVEEGRLPLWRGYSMNSEERLVRELVLQLKLGRAELAPLRRRHGIDPAQRFAASFERLAERGLAVSDDDAVTLTREGLLRADELLEELYLPQHRGVRYS